MRLMGGIWIPETEHYLSHHLGETPGFAEEYDAARMRQALDLPRRRTAIDIGANVGLWSRQLAAHFDNVEAFEPLEAAAECFRENVKAPNVCLRRCALGDREGAVDLVLNAQTTLKTHVAGAGAVEMRTLDSFAFALVDFIKIDCEGFDYFVLLGAEQTIARCAPAVLFEAKPGVSLKRYRIAQDAPRQLLERHGYRLQFEERGNYFMSRT